ncbi:MAG: PDZ domain-containing protein [Verrucomicrobia subdivision 3 bacterium]|nr:PDZ domain-containing protein [Limisphaerales bacterium]
MKQLLFPIIAAAIALPALAADKNKIQEPSAKEASGTYLGVAMGEIPPLTRAQLGLPEGIGVSVGHVAKGSPAEKAGLKVNDIITQLEDQLIINSQQLQTLIHTKKPGDEVTLTFLRKGKEHKAKAKLAKGSLAARTPQALRLQNGQLRPFNLPNGAEGQWKQFNFPNGLGQGQMRMFKLNPQNLNQLNEQLKNIPGVNPADLKKMLEAQGLQFGPAIPNGPNGNGAREFKFHFNFPGGGNKGDLDPKDPNVNVRKQVMTSVTISDNTGSYTLTTKNGKKTFSAKDPDGAESFTGPVDTKKQRDSLDRDLFKKLEQLEGMGAGKGGIRLNGLNLNGGNFKFDKNFDFKIEPFKPAPKQAPKKPRSDA